MSVLPLVTGLALLAAGIYMVTVSRFTLGRLKRLKKHGLTAEGQIGAKREVIAVDRRDCYVEVTFRTAAGETVVRENAVTPPFHDRTPGGSTVRIKYMPDAPDQCVIEDDRLSKAEPYAVLAIGIIFAVAGAAVLIIAPIAEHL